jgi:hypothetical protein
MPKHQANLNFEVTGEKVSSQYDKEGQLGVYVEIARPGGPRLPLSMGASNYCEFRGMLMKSDVYFRGKAEVAPPGRAKARIVIGDLPRVGPLRELRIGQRPLFTCFIPEAHGVLDDHTEGWFVAYDAAPIEQPEGLESVAGLGLSEEWLAPPGAPV